MAFSFPQLDKIIDLQSGKKIVAKKCLTLSEDYLQDHFPRFPVMPGVIMLEAMHQASSWLVHEMTDFSHSLILLKKARNVKYADFVAPGNELLITAEVIKAGEKEVSLKVQGTIDEKVAVSARLVLEIGSIRTWYPSRSEMEPRVRQEYRQIFASLYQPVSSPTEASFTG
ncbi:MAG: beta-hydroxyacyl-ACP dehydratase [Pirellulaceae bacterium]|nr:beta-hydroxyacyl-ACP dehydratase [Pirellulaceae bacterium]